MSAPFFLVDAFAERPFTGNPAGICFLPGPADEEWMQSLAMEMNQAETAYLWSVEDGFSLRWFTPAHEVDLCGHATLASAHVLWQTGALAADEEARFYTRSGLLTCRKNGELISMDFPAVRATPASTPDGVTDLFGDDIVACGFNRMDLLLVLPSPERVIDFKPDFAKLALIEARGIIITAQAVKGAGYDVVSRFFAPRFGIPEDSVTGSAHCCLGPYWADLLGRDRLVGYQASPRGGFVNMHIQGERVELSGVAQMVLKGSVEPVLAL